MNEVQCKLWTLGEYDVSVFITCNKRTTLVVNVDNGGVYGNPFQYSCLENPMDRGTWQATVHGVEKSQTQPSDFTFTFLSYVFGGKEYMRIEASAQFCCEPFKK